MQRSAKWLLTTVTRVYVSNIGVRGVRNVPTTRAVIFAGNHPSGLLDPLVLMAALPHKELTSVAKQSLFAMPFVGFFLAQMRAVPVAKAADPDLPPEAQASPEQRRAMNRAMFDTARARLLDERVNLCIFPEGTCHSSHEIKELKTGTARIALEVASAAPSSRVPIIPVGLSYSQPSGRTFRGSVLVDFGRPVNVTDELLRLFESSEEGARQACGDLTRRLEQHLRHVTISVPDWREMLAQLCKREGWAEPAYGASASGNRGQQLVRVEARGASFASDVGPLAPQRGVAVEVGQARQAARRAFFELSGAAGYEAFGDSDEAFVEGIHLGRRIYKPDEIQLTLGQYAKLTRNFISGFLHTGALRDPDFRALWRDILAYRDRLAELGLSDKYVSAHSIGSDPERRRLALLRQKAARDVAVATALAPAAALGALLHAPVGLTVSIAAERFGVGADGDRSVEATVKLIAGFSACCAWYGMVAAAAIALCPVHDYALLAPVAAVGSLGATGAAAAKAPHEVTLRRARGAVKLLSRSDNVDTLRATRAELKTRLRMLVDRHAPERMVGWWKGPPSERIVSEAELHAAGALAALPSDARAEPPQGEVPRMVTVTIPLAANRRAPNERAALTFCQRAAAPNRTALLWVPGRNDSFYHVHLLPRLLEEAGADLYALDLRRCGRAKVGDDSLPAVSPLLAHDSDDFDEYIEEFDEALRFMRNPLPLPADGTTRSGGCGHSYESVVVVAHSTGALAALVHARRGERRGEVDGYIFNSPFFSWNLPWYQRILTSSPEIYAGGFTELAASTLLGGGGEGAGASAFDPATELSAGGGPSEYSRDLHAFYEFPELLKSTTELAVTAGWARAVSNVHAELRRGELALPTGTPVLCLYTDADTVLDAVQIDDACDLLCPERSDGKRASLSRRGLVERKIETDEFDRSSHDVFAAPSRKRVDDALGTALGWLRVHFPLRGSEAGGEA